MDTPDALERLVHRIQELLVRSHSDVTWNDHILDPDNPEQSRQIDITIRRQISIRPERHRSRLSKVWK
jgi:hypothetical protein